MVFFDEKSRYYYCFCNKIIFVEVLLPFWSKKVIKIDENAVVWCGIFEKKSDKKSGFLRSFLLKTGFLSTISEKRDFLIFFD